MGSDVTEASIKIQLSKSIRPIGRLQKLMRDSGHDPLDVDLSVTLHKFDCQTCIYFFSCLALISSAFSSLFTNLMLISVGEMFRLRCCSSGSQHQTQSSSFKC